VLVITPVHISFATIAWAVATRVVGALLIIVLRKVYLTGQSHDKFTFSRQFSSNCYFEPNGGCVALVDNPGSNDSHDGVTDAEVLKKIAAFLEAE
jgi:hypothetical protein